MLVLFLMIALIPFPQRNEYSCAKATPDHEICVFDFNLINPYKQHINLITDLYLCKRNCKAQISVIKSVLPSKWVVLNGNGPCFTGKVNCQAVLRIIISTHLIS